MQIQIHITANSPEEARAVILALGQAGPLDHGVTSGITEGAQEAAHSDPQDQTRVTTGEGPKIGPNPYVPQEYVQAVTEYAAQLNAQQPIQPAVPPQAAAAAYTAQQPMAPQPYSNPNFPVQPGGPGNWPANVPMTPAQQAEAAQHAYNVLHPGQYQQPAAPAPSPQQAMPAQAPTYTLEQLRQAGGQLMTAGKQALLQAMLPKYGVQALTDLPKEHYGAVAAEMRAMGAQI